MYTKEDILEMLQNGQEAEDLAQSFIDALNDAVKAKDEIDREAEKAEKEKKNLKHEKTLIVQEIINMLFVYMETYYPEVYSETWYDIVEASEVVDAMDEAYEEICGFVNAFDDFKKLIDADAAKKNVKQCKPEEVKIPEEIKKIVDLTDLIDPIEKFLVENHLK